jgi:hypothetical protein
MDRFAETDFFQGCCGCASQTNSRPERHTTRNGRRCHQEIAATDTSPACVEKMANGVGHGSNSSEMGSVALA